MATKRKTEATYSARAKGTANVAVAGHGNRVSAEVRAATVTSSNAPTATALQALADGLSRLDTPDGKKIENAMGEALDEIKKPHPDKNEIGRAVERAVEYAKKVSTFAHAVESLKPSIENVVSWLGSSWHHILTNAGLIS